MKKKSEDNRFYSLVNEVGYDLALYCFCAVYDVEYHLGISKKDFEGYSKMYTEKFVKGEMDVSEIINEGMEDEERWIAQWGEGDANKPYTQNDYKKLDKLFETYSSRHSGLGGMDAQTEDTLRSVCVMRLNADKCIAKGGKDNISMASTLNKMIQELLSAEQLRKKDAKPIETARVDGIVDAISRKWGLSMECTREEAEAACARWLISHRYPMTSDAADHMLLAIINCTRNNNDIPELTELPKKMKFDKRFATEFADDPNDFEIEAYDYLGITRESDLPSED